jgi:hypothetical protein
VATVRHDTESCLLGINELRRTFESVPVASRSRPGRAPGHPVARLGAPLSLDDARRLVQGYVDHYNNIRLNSAIGYITPKDMLESGQQKIHAERDLKLEAARQRRRIRRLEAA